MTAIMWAAMAVVCASIGGLCAAGYVFYYYKPSSFNRDCLCIGGPFGLISSGLATVRAVEESGSITSTSSVILGCLLLFIIALSVTLCVLVAKLRSK